MLLDQDRSIHELTSVASIGNGSAHRLPVGHDPASEADSRLLGFDAIDSAPLTNLDSKTKTAALENLRLATTCLAREGGRGPAAARLLARDISLSRVQLRHRQALLQVALQRYSDGGGSERQVRLFEQLVDKEHSRLMASLDQLARLTSARAEVKVNAIQAAVLVGGRNG